MIVVDKYVLFHCNIKKFIISFKIIFVWIFIWSWDRYKFLLHKFHFNSLQWIRLFSNLLTVGLKCSHIFYVFIIIGLNQKFELAFRFSFIYCRKMSKRQPLRSAKSETSSQRRVKKLLLNEMMLLTACSLWNSFDALAKLSLGYFLNYVMDWGRKYLSKKKVAIKRFLINVYEDLEINGF